MAEKVRMVEGEVIHWKADVIIGVALVLAWLIRDRIAVAVFALLAPRRWWVNAMVRSVHEAEEEMKRRRR